MTYSEPLYTQLIVFIKSLGSGIIIGVIYDVMCSLRCIMGTSKKAYILCDSAFCIIAGLYSFFFMVVYNSGVVRFNILFSQAVGAVLFHLALGRYICTFADRAALTVRRILKALFFPFLALWKFGERMIKKLVSPLKSRLTVKIEHLKEKYQKKSYNIYKNTCKKNKNPYTKI